MTDQVPQMDFDYVTTIAEKAIGLMAEYIVSPSPDNFKLWFCYCQNNPPALKRTMDVIITNGAKFDLRTTRDLYNTFIDATTSPESAMFSDKLKDVLNTAEDFLSAAVADNRTHMNAISDLAEKGHAGENPVVLVESLMKELSKAVTRAASLETNLASASRELVSIRASLARAEEQSKTDVLTGLANRRAMEEFLKSAQMSAMETDEPLSIFLVDVDHFKRFNDTYGHNVGDQVLRLVAGSLKQNVRPSDLPARYGGEELIVVLPQTDLDCCFNVAERVRQAIASSRIKRRSNGEQLSEITVSIGVAEFKAGESMQQFIGRCDRALYAAKHAGRNRCITERQLVSEMAAAS